METSHSRQAFEEFCHHPHMEDNFNFLTYLGCGEDVLEENVSISKLFQVFYFFLIRKNLNSIKRN